VPPRKGRGRPAQPHSGAPLNAVDIQRAAAMKRYREQEKLSQAELASMLGVSQASVSAFEQAKTRIPDDVFEQLLASARDKMEMQTPQTAEEAQLRSALAGAGDLPPPGEDIPPEIMAALKAAADMAEGKGDPGVAEETFRKARAVVAEKTEAGLSAEQRVAATDVRMAYVLLGQILGRFLDPHLGTLIERNASDLSVSVVQAAEVSPLLHRIVSMLKVGPVSNCVILHVMLLVEYDRERQERLRMMREQAALTPAPTPQVTRTEPQPASTAEVLDPTLGAFAA
jgi:transcriptional regulator with XRE-family HTH domain